MTAKPTAQPDPGSISPPRADAFERQAFAANGHPPRAPLTLRVGVVGHRPDPHKRPDPDHKVLDQTLEFILSRIQQEFHGIGIAHKDLFFQSAPPPTMSASGLRIVSALAEGADQWVASKACALGYELQAVLPFHRGEYEMDFANPAVLNEHRRLRDDQALAVFEMDGSRVLESESYLAAGRVILNQSDLLIALWDGKDSQGVGGTGQIVPEAFQRSIPTIWINWANPADWRIVRSRERLSQPFDFDGARLNAAPNAVFCIGDTQLLSELVKELLLPAKVDRHGERDLGEEYFEERRRSFTMLGGWWDFVVSLLNFSPGPLHIRIPDFVPETQDDWSAEWKAGQSKLPESTIDWIDDNVLPHYAWANQLSRYYASLYRSSFAWLYFLGAIAVLLALIGASAEASFRVDLVLIGSEIVVITGIVWLTWHGRRRRWQQRWIEYRILAERLRLVRFSSLLGGAWQRASIPVHLASYGNPAGTWIEWHARSVERFLGLPNAVVDSRYLLACRDLLLGTLIEGQKGYHKSTIKRLRSVDRRLHILGEVLFFTTLIVCILHFAQKVLTGEATGMGALERWLIFCAACLPALAGAMAAIRNQGELHRVVQRSEAMADRLELLGEAVASLLTAPGTLASQGLQRAVEETTRLMYNEVLDWRIVFQDRPLVLPA